MWYLALRQELNPRTAQVESSHEPLFRDIKSNLTTASRAEKVFKTGIPLNQRGEHNVPKKYLKSALFTPEGDKQGYFVYHNGSFIAVESDFTHCFWYTVKYDNQKSCWVSHKLPKPEYGLDIPDSKVTDRSEWGPISDGKDDSDQSDHEDTKSEGHLESIDIKIPTLEEERSEKQLEKLAKHMPTLSRPRSHTASSRLPPITTVMAMQTTTEPTRVDTLGEGTSSAQKEEPHLTTHPILVGLVVQDSHTKARRRRWWRRRRWRGRGRRTRASKAWERPERSKQWYKAKWQRTSHLQWKPL